MTPSKCERGQTPVVAFIGAGGFASRHLFPAFRAAGARLKWVATRSGITAVTAAKRFGIERATSEVAELLNDADVNAVVIATRHDSHAHFACEALAAGKHVFVEKPLALDRSELADIQTALASAQRRDRRPILTVGFNRRFAPQVCKIAELLRTVAEPKSFVMTVNAGCIPADHWVHDPQIGGGRMIGEGCHFVHLLRFLAGQPIVQVQATQLGGRTRGVIRDDKVTCTLQFADGSFGTIHYLANGHRSYAKERLEVFAMGRVLQLDNFRTLTGYGWPKFRRMSSWRQDKGHHAEVKTFLDAVKSGGPSPIPWEELLEVSCVTMDIVSVANEGTVIRYAQDCDGLNAYLGDLCEADAPLEAASRIAS